jgi:L-gulonate 3-dehydrogenase
MLELDALTQGKPVAIVGAGLVGAGWALVFARAGLTVRIYDSNPLISSASLPLIEQQIADLTAYGLLSEPGEAILARLTVCQTLSQASGLSISPRVIIAHPVNPPYLVPVVEIVPSPETSPAAVEFTAALMEAVGQSVVHVRKEVAGFVLNRLQAVLLREAWALVEDGVASCEDIDKTVRDGLGWRWSFMGPFETIDLNAVGGVADYAQRLGPLYRSIAESRSHEREWSPELIKQIESQRREFLKHDDLESRRGWRDRALMAFSAQRRKADPR